MIIHTLFINCVILYHILYPNKINYVFKSILFNPFYPELYFYNSTLLLLFLSIINCINQLIIETNDGQFVLIKLTNNRIIHVNTITILGSIYFIHIIKHY